MGVLDQVTQMKNQGIPDEEIVMKLQEQRVSPKEINNAMEQAKIKTAVSDTEDMQPSIMKSSQTPTSNEYIYVPQTQESEQETYAPQSGGVEQDIYPPQPGYQQEGYYPQEGYDEYSASTGTDTDTIIEIAEQVFSEKMQKIQKQLEKLNEFQTLFQVKIDSTAERLKRIEKIIDNLQISILDKVGSYGKNLDNIKKEMSMMQDSFGKVIKHSAKKHHIIHKTPSHKTTKKISKK